MTTNATHSALSRRPAFAGLRAGTLGLTLGARGAGAAQGMTTAGHPLMGMWLAFANPARRGDDPQFPAPSLFAADGTVVLGFVPAEIGMDGAIQFFGSPMGVWEPYDEQTGHFTAVQVLADKAGMLIGSATIDGHPHVSADGLTFVDDGSLVTVTIRDAAGAVVTVIPPGPTGYPVTATRVRVGHPGVAGDEDATPVP